MLLDTGDFIAVLCVYVLLRAALLFVVFFLRYFFFLCTQLSFILIDPNLVSVLLGNILLLLLPTQYCMLKHHSSKIPKLQVNN